MTRIEDLKLKTLILRKHFIVIFVLLYIFFISSFHIKVYSQTVLKGGIRTVVEHGQTIEINLSTPINYYYSQTGDNVAAYTTEDIFIGENTFIPKGSRLEGLITKIIKPKHFGQNGAFEIDFNEIVTEENIHIPIYASVTTDTSSRVEKIASILTYDSALVAYGTFHGALAGIQYGGIPLAITSHGISVLAGAGVGLGAGIAGSVARKGKVPNVLTQINIPVVLKSDLVLLGDLPSIKKEAQKEEYKGFRFFPQVKNEEIKIQINEIKKEHSNLYGNYIIVNFNLKNNSNKSVSFSDFILVDKNKNETLHSDLFLTGTEALKTIKPFEEANGSLTFLISGNKDNYLLTVVDPLDGDKIVEIPLKDKQ